MIKRALNWTKFKLIWAHWGAVFGVRKIDEKHVCLCLTKSNRAKCSAEEDGVAAANEADRDGESSLTDTVTLWSASVRFELERAERERAACTAHTLLARSAICLQNRQCENKTFQGCRYHCLAQAVRAPARPTPRDTFFLLRKQTSERRIVETHSERVLHGASAHAYWATKIFLCSARHSIAARAREQTHEERARNSVHKTDSVVNYICGKEMRVIVINIFCS